MVLPLLAALAVWSPQADARQAQQAPQAPRTARASAPLDVTGNWVSIITEDWRFRMVTPPKGDYTWVPLNAKGRQVADTWDPDKDAAAGEVCKAYGAVALMRRPTRLRISWQDDETLRIETDMGQQTRLLRFTGGAPAGGPTLQGYSTATWERAGGRGAAAASGSLKVVTTRMLPGYLRTNGVPYSGDAVLTEWFDRHADFGVEWLTLTQAIEDPTYLNETYYLTSHFKREPDGSKWDPTPCQIARPPALPAK